MKKKHARIKKSKKKYRLKYKNIFMFFFLIFMSIFIFSIINIIIWKTNSNKTKIIENNLKNTGIREVLDSDKTEIINNNADESDPYWKYIKMNLINVDFKKLKEINDSTVGWIQVNSTNINYPFVQTYDNDFYLNHTYDKSYNTAGWVFLDYRNNNTDYDYNSIIYVHGRLLFLVL